jgi:uncharacterized protein YgiM (DUF1202 family)
MSFESMSTQDEAPKSLWTGQYRFMFIVAAVVLSLLAATGLFFVAKAVLGHGKDTNMQSLARSYRALARTELRKEPGQASAISVVLKEGTTVSGVPAGERDGVPWLELTAVDGAKGYAPKSLFQELGPATASTQVTTSVKRIVTSALVNLRETPSMSGKILGVAEGGTRMVSDGSVQSEGETWLRVPLDAQTTVFILQRFTTADDDTGGSDGIEDGQGTIGVPGHATQIANVQATPLPDGRIVRALQVGETVRVIGQTSSGISWYVLRLNDGSQGFAPTSAIKVDAGASRWEYPDGTVAPGPNVPQGQTQPIGPKALGAKKAGEGTGAGATNGVGVPVDFGAEPTTQGSENPGSNPTTPSSTEAQPPQ